MPLFTNERDPRDIEAVHQLAEALLSVAGKQAILNAREIIEHADLQRDKGVIVRARRGLVDVLVEIKRSQKEVEQFMLKLDEYLSAIAQEEKGGENEEASVQNGETHRQRPS
ncbi:hypothetical protein CspeluHIS016_0305480 [Cutaneotrichosporon spelunceum]|uniref:Uncharacterized protein n=1 Tax=Cutaneotrichosporon spelunceum TaxID=1672016 RepID=A0AAD3YC33_9TREE|nr:hypothetical protein CspeluHIS016_0305480 [Cutaneotrichosporon spelunceum]